jgi:hypothetical protein
MSSGLGKGVGVPVKLLHESEGHVVTVREDSRIIARERARGGETRDARRGGARAEGERMAPVTVSLRRRDDAREGRARGRIGGRRVRVGRRRRRRDERDDARVMD